MQARLALLTTVLLVANQMMVQAGRVTIDLDTTILEPKVYTPPGMQKVVVGEAGEPRTYAEVVTITPEREEPPVHLQIPVPNAMATVKKLPPPVDTEHPDDLHEALKKQLSKIRPAFSKSANETGAESDWPED